MLQLAGVYEIVCQPTGVRYVGSAICFARRFCQHKSDLTLGKHKSTYMQRAWNKYGSEAFVFAPILVCEPQQAVFFEQRALDSLQPEFNTAKIAGSTLGTKRTPEQANRQRAIRSAINLAKPDKGVGHMTAIVQSDAFRKKQSERMRQAHADGNFAASNAARRLRQSKQHLVYGESLTVVQLAEKYGRTAKSISRRIERGITGDELVAPAYKVTRTHGR